MSGAAALGAVRNQGPLDEMTEDVSEGGVLDPSKIPDTDDLRRLASECARFADLEARIRSTKEALELMSREHHELESRTLPDLFDRCMTDKLGVPGAMLDVVVAPVYHANIRADWPEEQREAAFLALEEIGGSELIRLSLTISLHPGQVEEMRRLQELVRGLNWLPNAAMSVSRSVPWNTLTAFLRELVERGVQGIPLDALGARIGRYCKIVKRRGRG